jgi:hypothetical protein
LETIAREAGRKSLRPSNQKPLSGRKTNEEGRRVFALEERRIPTEENGISNRHYPTTFIPPLTPSTPKNLALGFSAFIFEG